MSITYRSRAVRALVLLHDDHLRRFLATWQRAKAVPVVLPDPEIRVAPEPSALALEAGGYMEHVLTRWRAQLHDVSDEQLERPEYLSRWKTRYCVEAMLEHAGMP